MATHLSYRQTLSREGKGGELGKYDLQSMRDNMSTGGGQPIPAGQKWTNERRVMQPRDPDTGHFTYNSDAGLRKKFRYKRPDKERAVPVSARKLGFQDKALKKGDVINIGGKTWVVTRDMDVNEVYAYFKDWQGTQESESVRKDAVTGKVYTVREGTYEGDFDGEFRRWEVDGKGNDLYSRLDEVASRKRGRQSRSDKEILSKGQYSAE